MPFHNPNKAVSEEQLNTGGGGCSDTCMMRGAKTKGHEAGLRLQLTVPFAGASPLSVFSSTSTSFFSFSSYKIKAYRLISVTFSKEFILKCDTFLLHLILNKKKRKKYVKSLSESLNFLLDLAMLNVFSLTRNVTLTLLWLPAHSSSSASPAAPFLPLCLLNKTFLANHITHAGVSRHNI